MSKWEMVRLGDVCEKKIQSLPANSNYEIEYIDISSIDNVSKKIITTKEMNAIGAPSRAKQILEKNDILVSTVRPNLNAVAMLQNDSKKVIVGSTGYCVLRCVDKVFTKYVFYFCQSNSFISKLVKVAKGASYPAVSDKDVKDTEIPRPPLEVQKQIAQTLDTVSELIALRKNQLAELDNLIKATFYDMFGDPVVNEKGWDLVEISSIADCNSGGTPTRSNPNYFLGDIDWYSAGELNTRYLIQSKEKLTMVAIHNSAAKIFKNGSMLVGMYDTAAFKLGILTKEAASNQACANININENLVNIEWLYDCAQIMRPFFLTNRRGIRQKNLNLGMIKQFKIPLPPLILQNQFAEIVTKIEEQKALVQKAIDESQYLFDSLMSQYFE